MLPIVECVEWEVPTISLLFCQSDCDISLTLARRVPAEPALSAEPPRQFRATSFRMASSAAHDRRLGSAGLRSTSSSFVPGCRTGLAVSASARVSSQVPGRPVMRVCLQTKADGQTFRLDRDPSGVIGLAISKFPSELIDISQMDV